MTTDLGRTVARHWLLAALLVIGTVVRLLSDAGLGGTAVVGLAAAAAAYVVCVRWGVWRWLAALAALSAVLDDRMLLDQPWRPVVGLLLVSVGLVVLSWRGLLAPPPVLVSGALLVVAGGALGSAADVASHDPGVVSSHVGPVAGIVTVVLAGIAVIGGGRSVPIAPRILAGATAVLGLGGGLDEAVWWPVAGALGLTLVLRGERGKGVRRPQSDPVDEAALQDFAARYGTPALGPVVVVIAAYNEADGIPGVLETMPEQVCGLHTDVVVVDDGSSDGTSAALARSRAHVVSCRTNRGQGAALRLGYRVAREHGAAYVLTTDADGQYDVGDMPAVLGPILENRADFVTGSRILGRQHTRDRVRRLGVHVFAWLATLLTGQRLTDTSFGLRAMRAEVTGAVTLNQPQYQSSELLLGVISHGFRVLEVPGTMHVRAAGSTKKGRNLVYGRRYAGVMTGTWWREGLPRPVTDTASALRHTRTRGG